MSEFRRRFTSTWGNYTHSEVLNLRNISSHVQSAVKERTGEEVDFLKGKSFAEKFIKERIIDESIIPDPELRSYAQTVHDAFIDQKLSGDFFADMYSRFLEAAFEKNAVSYPSSGIPAIRRDVAREELWKMAKELGFEKEITLDAKTILPFDEFRVKIVKPDQVFWDDSSYPGIVTHGRSSHYLQMLYARQTLNKKFGNDAYVKFFSFLNTKEGYRIWHLLFDLGPTYRANPSHAAFFTNNGTLEMMGLE